MSEKQSLEESGENDPKHPNERLRTQRIRILVSRELGFLLLWNQYPFSHGDASSIMLKIKKVVEIKKVIFWQNLGT